MSPDRDQADSQSTAAWQLREEYIQRFETAWRMGQRPDIDHYLPSDPAHRQAVLIELVHADLECRLKAGEEVSVPAYVERYPELGVPAIQEELQAAAAEHRQGRQAARPEAGQGGAGRNGGAEQPRREGSSTLPESPAADTAKTKAYLAGRGPASAQGSEAPTLAHSSTAVPGGWPRVPGFEILGELGRGGMGVVYRARQVALNRPVALKMILAGSHAGAEGVTRFQSEAEAVARLRHPNIVQIYEVGEADGKPFFALEFVEGGSLAKKLAGSPLPPREAARLVELLARAAHHAHQQGVIHRDLKPANILLAGVKGQGSGVRDTREAVSFLNPDPSPLTPKITDFGLAKRLEAGPGQTQSGAILGTPSYMAPEQALGENRKIGPAVDVYALGAILYEALTGRPPFKGATVLETLDQVRTQEPVSPTQLQPGLPRDLKTICLKCLQKDPSKRYSSALELADDLARYLAREPIRARPVGAVERTLKWARRRPAWAALGIVSLLAAVVFVGGVFWHAAQLQSALDDATRARTRAEVSEHKARQAQAASQGSERRARRYQYASDLRSAYQFWRNGEVRQAQQILSRHQRGAAGEDNRCGFEWHLLHRLVHHGDRLTLPCHDGEGRCVAYSPDGKTLAVATGNVIRLWNTATWQVRATLRGHDSSPVQAIGFSPDGKLLAAGDRDSLVIISDVATGRKRAALKDCRGLVSCVGFSPDGRYLAAGGSFCTTTLWRTAGWRVQGRIRKHTEDLTCLAFSPDGKYLGTGSSDRSVRLFDVRTGWKELSRLDHETPVHGVTFSPGGKLLAVAEDTGFRLWNPGRARQVAVVRGPAHATLCLAFSRDGRQLVTGHDGGQLWLWDVADRTVRRNSQEHKGAVQAVAFSPDGRAIASASRDRTVSVWYPARAPEHQDLVGSVLPGAVLTFSPAGDTVALACRDRTVKLLDSDTVRVRATLARHNSDILGLAFSPDGKTLASAGTRDRLIRLWDPADGRLRGTRTVPGTSLGCLAFSPDGKRLAAGGSALWVWDLEGGAAPARLSGHAGEVQALAFSADSKLLATGSADHTVKVWELARGKVRTSLAHPAPVLAVAFASPGPAGKIPSPKEALDPLKSRVPSPLGDGLLSTGDALGTIRLWDTAAGKELASVHPHNGPVHSLAFSPEGSTLASGGVDWVPRLWHVARGRRPPLLLGTEINFQPTIKDLIAVRCLAFSPEGKVLATTTTKGVAQFWNLAAWQVQRPQGMQPRAVHSLAFSPDGKTLAAGCAEKLVRIRNRVVHGDVVVERSPVGNTRETVRFWDLATGRERVLLRGEKTATNHAVVAYSPDGKTLASGSSDGSVWLWDLATGRKRATLYAGRGARGYAALDSVLVRSEGFIPIGLELSGAVLALRFSPDGRVLAAACADGTIKLWDAATARQRAAFSGGQTGLTSLAFSPDSSTLAVIPQGRVRLWDVAAGRWRQTLGQFGDSVSSLAFSPGGTLLAIGARDSGRIQLWNLRRQTIEAVLTGHLDSVPALAFTPDGKTLASGSFDGKVKLWHVATAQELATLEAGEDKVRTVAFSPDGRILAAGMEALDGSGQIHLWRASPSPTQGKGTCPGK
jgi:WD40 repeat protein